MNLFKLISAELKYQFQSKYGVIGFILGIFLNFVMYFYTAKAFSPNLGITNEYLKYGYFNYIILGEMCLLFPTIAIVEGQEYFFRLKEWGILEQLSLREKTRSLTIFEIYLALTFIKMIYFMASLIIAVAFFNLNLEIFSLLKLIMFQLFIVFFFFPFYLINIFMTAIFKKRTNLMIHALTLLNFFSGAYFPLEIFKDERIRYILKNSPLFLIVEGTRKYIYKNIFLSIQELTILFFYFLMASICSYLIFKLYLKEKQERLIC